MSVAAASGSRLDLWDDRAEERRFRVIAAAVIVLTLLFAFVVPLIDIPAPAVRFMEEVSPRFAQLLQDREPPAPPPVVPERAQEAVPESVPEAMPEPPLPAEPLPAPEPLPQEPLPAAPATPESTPIPAARERAARSGLLALSQEIAQIRSENPLRTLEDQELRAADAERPPQPDAQAVIASRAGAASGGLGDSLPTQGDATLLAEHELTQVEAPVVVRDAVGVAEGTAPALPARSSDDIQRVFDENRAALNTLYRRALRNDPTLRGTVVLRLVILPSGVVADCEIVSSELRDADLERRLVARVRQFDFGARDVAVTTTTYPIDFFPG